ncbi:MAG: hypothetical protein HQL97_04550 [Magnetococcales bacterium]|nr:hypothetical protein [Magnetococcales bacterium]
MHETIADQIILRQRSVAAYQANLDTFRTMLTALPDGAIPAGVQPYLTMRAEELPIDLDEVLVEQIFAYQRRDSMQRRVRAERQQQAMEESVIAAMMAQIPEAEREQAIQDAAARLATTPVTA